MTRKFPSVLFLAMATLLAGCGGEETDRVAIEATVTLNGQPVEVGRLMFEPAEGTKSPQSSGLVKDGKSNIKQAQGPEPGDFNVSLILKGDASNTAAPAASSTRQGTPEMQVSKGRVNPKRNKSANTTSAKLKIKVPEADGAVVELKLDFKGKD